jgi:hypothetical protein
MRPDYIKSRSLGRSTQSSCTRSEADEANASGWGGRVAGCGQRCLHVRGLGPADQYDPARLHIELNSCLGVEGMDRLFDRRFAVAAAHVWNVECCHLDLYLGFSTGQLAATAARWR